MAIKLSPPWQIAMSRVGPSITYAEAYRFNVDVDIASGKRTYRAAGPGQTYGAVVEDIDFVALYQDVNDLMGAHGLARVVRSMSGVVNAEWEQVEGIAQAISIVLGGGLFSVIWRVDNVDFDDADGVLSGTAVVVNSLDPALVAHNIELLVGTLDKKLEQMLMIAGESTRS